MFVYTKEQQIVLTIAYSIILFISSLTYLIFKNKSYKSKRIPIYVISITLLVLEIFKQIKNAIGYSEAYFFTFIYGLKDNFDLFSLPFHFCSFFIFFAFLSFVFRNNKKIGLFFENMTFIWSSIITFLIILSPELIYSFNINKLYYDGFQYLGHNLIFHWLVLLYFIISFKLKIYNLDLRKIYQVPICVLIYGSVVIPMAYILNENYCQVLYNGVFTMFDSIYQTSNVLYDSVLLIIGIVLMMAFYILIYFIDKLRKINVDNNINKNINYLDFIVVLLVLLLSALTDYYVLGKYYGFYIFVSILLLISTLKIINIYKKIRRKNDII